MGRKIRSETGDTALEGGSTNHHRSITPIRITTGYNELFRACMLIHINALLPLHTARRAAWSNLASKRYEQTFL
jgi:hypothetical protein